MKSDELLDAIGEARDEYVQKVRDYRKKKPLWVKRLAVAACLCFVLFGVIGLLVRFDFNLGASCGANPGTIVEGVYYFHEPHKGVMRYVPG